MFYWTGNEASYSINEEVQLMWDKTHHDSCSHREGDRGEGGSCPPRPARGATSVSLVTAWALDMLCGWINSTVHVKGKEGKDAKTKQMAWEKSPVLKATSHSLFIYPPQKTAHLPCAPGEGLVHALSLLLVQITASGWETWAKQPQCIAGTARPKRKCWGLTRLCREKQGLAKGRRRMEWLQQCFLHAELGEGGSQQQL